MFHAIVIKAHFLQTLFATSDPHVTSFVLKKKQ